MSPRFVLGTLAAAGVLASAAAPVAAETVVVKLRGHEEVPANATHAFGDVRLKIDDRAQTIEYTLTYEALEGDALQAHIHVGQHGVNGGISAWLCGTATLPGPAGTPVCPVRAGTVAGVLTPAQVVGPASQLVDAGEFDDLVAAIRAGVAYANVHSTRVPGGEIRGQLK
jgi:hypothetical protein